MEFILVGANILGVHLIMPKRMSNVRQTIVCISVCSWCS